MTVASSDSAWPRLTTWAILGVLIFWGVYTVLHVQSQSDLVGDPSTTPRLTTAAIASRDALHPVHVRRPTGPPQVVVENPATGATTTVSCTTCHATRPPDPEPGRTKSLADFHTEIVFDHGASALSCLSCHDPDDYDSLRSADGRRIEFSDVMQMCAQCHGRQHDSYVHGAHGGMNGYWDLSRGPRTRRTCTDCHDPHAPAFPSMQPTFKPIDRGLHPEGLDGHE